MELIETVTKEQMIRAHNLNPKEFEYGQLVYWVGSYSSTFDDYTGFGHGNYKEIHWGTVIEHYCSEIVIARYGPVDIRTINGVPAADFKTPTDWKQLPKDWEKRWNYKDELFSEKEDNISPEFIQRFGDKFKNPKHLYWASIEGLLTHDDIIDAIKLGVFVNPTQIECARFESEITKSGWRIRRNYNHITRYSGFAAIPYYRVYKTRGEAQKELDDYITELNRQAALSDRDWSIEQIDHDLDRWQCLYKVSDEDKEVVRNRLLDLDRIEEVETRLIGGHIEWKYSSNRRWKEIII